MENGDRYELFAQVGLPQFEQGIDGYPLPGKVVKYYREHMTYIDRDGKAKHWTQADLAERLGLKKIMVNLMENNNQGLDSIERRKALVTILNIPPALLGLGSLDPLVEMITRPDVAITQQGNAKRYTIGKDTINQYQGTLEVYSKMYDQGLTYTTMHEVEKWTKRIEQAIKNVNADDKNALFHVLWDYEILCAKIHGSDLHNWNRAFEHIDNALEIATVLNDRDLQAASFYMRSVYHFRQGRPGLAKVDIEGALMYAKGALPQTKASIHSQYACVHADDTSLAGITLVQNNFEKSEKYIDAESEIRSISFGKDDYLLDTAYTLIAIDRSAEALEFIEDAERYINSSNKRYLVFLDILQARCYIHLKKPKYEFAVQLLKSAIEDSKELRVARNIDQIERLYGKLVESSYGKSPDVADTGMLLRELKRR